MAQSRTKLDLYKLLAKYEKGSLNQQQQFDHISPLSAQINQTVKESRYIGLSNFDETVSAINAVQVAQNFQMSKSQCQQFLLKIRQQLSEQQRGLKNYSELSIKQIHQNFTKQHETIKKQILLLLQKAFQQNQRIVKDQLKLHSQTNPLQFIGVHQIIGNFDKGVERLLNKLKTKEYKKAIAQVVLQDYNAQLLQLRKVVRQAKEQYASNLGGTQVNELKIKCLKNDFESLFIVHRKRIRNISNSYTDIAKTRPSPSRARAKIFQNNGKSPRAYNQYQENRIESPLQFILD